MKRRSISTHKNGFILPSVLIISALVLLYLSSSILSYWQDMHMTRNIIEQVQSETLFQMGYTAYRTEGNYTASTDTRTYQFPSGYVTITPTIQNEKTLLLHVFIETNAGFHTSVTKSLKLQSESHNSDELDDTKE
jgi:hypothetical protein